MPLIVCYLGTGIRLTLGFVYLWESAISCIRLSVGIGYLLHSAICGDRLSLAFGYLGVRPFLGICYQRNSSFSGIQLYLGFGYVWDNQAVVGSIVWAFCRNANISDFCLPCINHSWFFYLTRSLFRNFVNYRTAIPDLKKSWSTSEKGAPYPDEENKL